MRYWTAACVWLLTAFVLSARTPESIEGFFVSTARGWVSRGGNVSARLEPGRIVLGSHGLEHAGAAPGTPWGAPSGEVLRYDGSAVTRFPVAHSVTYADIYPGISLLFRYEGNTLKSDYLVSAGADPGAIRFRYSGATSMYLDRGDLIVDGLREAAPVAWQDTASGRRPVAAAYRIDNGLVGLELGDYDRRLPLTIDPYVVATWGFQGGSQIDNVNAIAVDASGYVYLAGSTESLDMLSSPLLPRSTGVDAFVLKIEPTQNRVVWAAYLGGTAHDEATAVATHPSGGVVVAGFTSSSGFPVSNAYQSSRQGGSHDAFLVRFDAGGAMVFGTYFGGSGTDRAYGVAVAPSGNIWIAGESDSSDFPRLAPISGAARGGMEAVASRFSAAGALLSSTTFGGSATDRARAIACDSAGEAYLTGSTESSDYPTLSPFQAASGGSPDAFVAKIAADGTSLRYSSYLGGPPREVGMPESGTALTVDASGAAWLTGLASSLSFPLVTPIQASYGGGNTDAFLAKISPAGGLVYSSYVGGNGSDEGAGVTLLGDGSVALAGSTTSTDLPLVANVAGPSGASWDGFIVRLNAAGNARVLSTYVSGSASDTLTGIAARGSSIWVAGNSASTALLPSGAPRGLIDGYFAELKDTASAATIGAPASKIWQVAGTGCDEGWYTGTRQMNWTPGAQCTVTMHWELFGDDTRQVLASWSDGATANPRVITAGPGTWTSTYRTEHTVRVSATTGGTASPTHAWIPAGGTVQLVANPAPGYAFSGWSGGITGNPATVTVNAPVTAVASFACSYVLSAVSASVLAAATTVNVAVNTGAGCSVSATSNSAWISVSVTGNTARLDIGANAGGARTGTASIAGQTFTVTQAATTTTTVGIFPPDYRTWDVTGAGCQAGSYTGSATLTWTIGTQCTVTMHPTQGATSRQVFHQWSDGSTANPRTFSVTGAASWSATYRTEYLVQTAASAGGSAAPASVWVASGTQVQLTATPSSGYVFSGWTGGISGNPALVTVAAPISATASFACSYTLGSTSASISAAAATLTVPVTTGSGCTWSVTSNAAWIGSAVVSGSTVLTVLANSGAARVGTVSIAGQTYTVSQAALATVAVTFVPPAERIFQVVGDGCQAGWYTGPATLSWLVGASCTVTMHYGPATDTRQVFASWSDGSTANPRVFPAVAATWAATYRTEYLVRTFAGTGGTAAPDNVWVAAGALIQIAATPSAGYAFTGWSGGISGNPATLTITGPTVATASFACAYTLGSTSASVANTGGTLSVAVTTGAGCTWSATSHASWIAVSTSSSSATLSIVANSGTARSGTLTIAGQTYTITQSAVATVPVTFSPPADRTWTVTGNGCEAGQYTGARTLGWNAGAQCSVAMQGSAGATTRTLFVQWSDGSTANPRTFSAVAASWGATYRTEHLVQTTATSGGTATPAAAWVASGSQVQLVATPSAGYAFGGWSGGIAGNPATVTVNGPVAATVTFVCDVAVAPNAIDAGSGPSVHRIAVTSACAWSGSSGASWISVSTAPGEAVLTVAANPGPARSAAVSIGNRSVLVTQAAVCTAVPSKSSIASPATGEYATITFSVTPAGCAWRADSTASWAQVYPLSGTGGGSVSVNVFAHFGVTARTGTVTIGNTVVPLGQAGASGTANERFAGLMYYNFLGRIGAKEEIAFHAATLNAGAARKDVAFNFYNAEEFNRAGRFVAGLYVGLLDRDAEFGGWLFQRGAYVTGFVDQPKLVSNFLGTPEYVLKFGKPDDSEFVRLLYRYILRREASPEEVVFQAGALKTVGRVQLAMNFLNSTEFRTGMGPRLTAFLLYACLLLRDGSPAEREAMAARVVAQTDMRQLIESLIASPEFENALR